MNQTPKRPYDYLRARISFQLRTLSPLHCGDGGTIATAESDWQEAKGSEGHINTVCRGHRGPYIPASTLRGSLRERCPDPALLFGTAHGNQGTAGALRVYDAFLSHAAAPSGDGYWNAKNKTTLRDGVSIDPVTGTAASGKLFAFEIVPEGSLFEVEIEADRITQAGLADLLGLIQGWDGTAAAALGKGRSRGWGLVALDGIPGLGVLNDDDLRAWLKKPAAEPLKPRTTPVPAAAAKAPAAVQTIQLRLEPSASLLVNEPGRVRPRSDDEHEPALEFMRNAKGAPLVPGSTLRGALRGRARRILATIAHQACDASPEAAGEAADHLADRLFGTEGRRSALWIGDANTANHKVHVQHFNAVDRFTGGVAPGALYAVTAADCLVLEATATLDLARLPKGDWWRGLLLFLARDLIEGDLAIGWGKSRGFGAFRAVFAPNPGSRIDSFEGLLAALVDRYDGGAAASWIAALHTEVKQAIQAAEDGGKS